MVSRRKPNTGVSAPLNSRPGVNVLYGLSPSHLKSEGVERLFSTAGINSIIRTEFKLMEYPDKTGFFHKYNKMSRNIKNF